MYHSLLAANCYEEGIEKHVSQYDNFFNLFGDYVESYRPGVLLVVKLLYYALFFTAYIFEIEKIALI